MKQRTIFFTFCLAAIFAASANATLWGLNDQNSHITISDDTPHGAYAWNVESDPQVAAGNFWYREGSTGGESYLGTVAPSATSQPSSDMLTLFYDLGAFTIVSDYEIQGSPAGTFDATFSAFLTVSNASASALELHLFHEWDYSIDTGSSADTMQILNGNQISHQDGNFIGESLYTPDPDHFEATTGNLIVELADGSPTTFNDVAGPIGPSTDPLSAGFQWDFTLAVGETRTFDVEHHVFMIPEPSTWALMLTASLLFGIKPLRRKLRSLRSLRVDSNHRAE
ncbi:MAG: hypothetical protein KJ626_05060 [Verrucomicrobia bacterium]|nr:hypothetical protein [Verrucomicrobiota bacterium]